LFLTHHAARALLLFIAHLLTSDSSHASQTLIDYITRSIPLYPSAKFVILGDFNLPKLNTVITVTNSPLSVNNLTHTFTDFYYQFGLSQLVCNIQLASHMLSNTNWHALFENCRSINQYWTKFKDVCLSIIKSTSPLSHPFKRIKTFPKSIRRAILKKKRLWRKYVLDCLPSRLQAFKDQCRTVSAQLRGFRTRREHIVAFERSKSEF